MITVGKKFEISLAHMQIEVGTCQQVLSAPYDLFGHLATRSLNKCLRGETEPFGIHIQGDDTKT
jgi:hypothetical protein